LAPAKNVRTAEPGAAAGAARLAGATLRRTGREIVAVPEGIRRYSS